MKNSDDSPLRTSGYFSLDDIERQLTDFWQDADTAIRRLRIGRLPVFMPTNKKTAAYTASIDELVLVDSAGGNVTITIPVASSENKGHFIAISRQSASNNITLKAPSGSINNSIFLFGSSSITLTAAVRLFLYVSDCTNWWGTE